jgi:hypothetical protein
VFDDRPAVLPVGLTVSEKGYYLVRPHQGQTVRTVNVGSAKL